MKHNGRPYGSALERGMRFARWAMARPKPPTVDDVITEFAINRAQARTWLRHWLRVGPHLFKSSTDNEKNP